MTFRHFDAERNTEAVQGIWMEVGWAKKDQLESVDATMSAGRA